MKVHVSFFTLSGVEGFIDYIALYVKCLVKYIEAPTQSQYNWLVRHWKS